MSKQKESATVRQSSLDISEEELRQLSTEFSKLVTQYFLEISNLRLYPETSAGKTTAKVGSTLAREGRSLEELMADCRAILENSRHNGHPRFFGYVASPATPAGAFADLLASAVNANASCWRSAPAGTEIENVVVGWLGSMIGYGEDVHGLLTSGGSTANLIAIQIAHRAKTNDDVRAKGLWNSSAPMTIYASDQVHMSIPKAADILGLGREQVRTVESDNDFRLDVRRLRERIERDLRHGLQPFCVVASAGTVNTGAVDRMRDVADVAREFGLWFHVDGAYGAPAALDERKRALLNGLERADSVSLDAHKWLYVPIDAGCLLFHDPQAPLAAFAATDADYIKVLNADRADESFAFWDYGMELSRRFRALKIWFTLKYYGQDRIAQAISDDNSLAEYMEESVKAADDFELVAPVELSICCFRYVPQNYRLQLSSATEEGRTRVDAELDQLNTQIMVRVQHGGEAYLSNATVRGKFALRACITNFRTTRADIDKTLEVIRAAGLEIMKARRGETEMGRHGETEMGRHGETETRRK
ncbi:MAG TPA: pyridoxal-dependent decarboxylase [Pyrinomonadaceae bacterium]|nr:pyridoxal-dependent decarboxylase [Pyrinomonadaceae bacterium]